ncbi:hypothetical protein [Streptomyces sp. 8ZJF_21]|uniref:hypothetical protein n=1 Tax=Streptomyces sp. 8ZJF_21 TaxID=2903141 RepID=UPI001E5F22C5|nr:hypothetical protein [Streptomyces sp. 8ZJF_21]MCD9589411.1 hypothetical protein [Streptomyces sp. 8ZJF_21]
MTHPVSTSRRFVLARRPHGQVREEDFALVRADVGAVPDGGVLLETLFISLDPAIRSWLDDRPSYLPPVAIGDPVRSLGLARVTESRNPAFCVGDIVRGFTGWQERHVVPSPGAEWDRITPKPGVPLETWLGALGITGLTAWIGVYDILRPSAGDTVLVTAAGLHAQSTPRQTGRRRDLASIPGPCW